MSNFDINVDRRTDGRKSGRLYRTLLQAGATKADRFSSQNHLSPGTAFPSSQDDQSSIINVLPFFAGPTWLS